MLPVTLAVTVYTPETVGAVKSPAFVTVPPVEVNAIGRFEPPVVTAVNVWLACVFTSVTDGEIASVATVKLTVADAVGTCTLVAVTL
jgi:hypothetical protein